MGDTCHPRSVLRVRDRGHPGRDRPHDPGRPQYEHSTNLGLAPQYVKEMGNLRDVADVLALLPPHSAKELLWQLRTHEVIGKKKQGRGQDRSSYAVAAVLIHPNDRKTLVKLMRKHSGDMDKVAREWRIDPDVVVNLYQKLQLAEVLELFYENSFGERDQNDVWSMHPKLAWRERRWLNSRFLVDRINHFNGAIWRFQLDKIIFVKGVISQVLSIVPNGLIAVITTAMNGHSIRPTKLKLMCCEQLFVFAEVVEPFIFGGDFNRYRR